MKKILIIMLCLLGLSILANTQLAFRGFVLGSTTKEEVIAKEGNPLKVTTIHNYLVFMYLRNILNHMAIVHYAFENDILAFGMYGFIFTDQEIFDHTLRQIYQSLEKILNKKYGKLILKSFGKYEEMMKPYKNEELFWIAVETGLTDLMTVWLVNNSINKSEILSDITKIKDNTETIIIFVDVNFQTNPPGALLVFYGPLKIVKALLQKTNDFLNKEMNNF